MKELRVIIAGGRDFADYPKLMDESTRILSEVKSEDVDRVRIISGNARGADKLGEQFASASGYELSKFPADWNGLGKRAGYIRNEQMAKFAVEDGNHGVLIAFWNGESRGTKHMIDLAKKHGVEVHVVNYSN